MAILVQIKVAPGSGRQEWKLDKSGIIKCYLKSQPEKGLANKELIRALSKALRVPLSEIEIVSGLTSRLKKIKVTQAFTFDELLARLGICRQIGMFD